MNTETGTRMHRNDGSPADGGRRAPGPAGVAAGGALIGIAFALFEFVFHALRGAPTLLVSLLPPMIVLYGAYWALVTLLVAVVFRALGAAGLRTATRHGVALAAVAGLATALTFHAALVSGPLRTIERPWSTVAFASVFVVAGLVAFAFDRIRVARRFPGTRRAWLLTLALIALSLPLAWFPERGRGETRDAARGNPQNAATAPRDSRLPNVLLVVFDTMRYDHLGSAGYFRATSPVIDTLAREGTVFERAYAPSSWTLPSTASILTSRYPSSHGVISPASALPADIETLPALLRDGGYRTGLFSGNPLVEPNFGFGNGFAYVFTPSKPLMLGLFYLPEYWKRTFARLPGAPRHDELVVRYESLWRPHAREEWIRGGRIAEELLQWIDASPPAPFFAHVQIMEPHDPYEGSGRFGPEGVSEKPYSVGTGLHPFDRRPGTPEEERRVMVDRYDDDIREADRVLGEILRGLAARGIREETWVVVTSDHGEEFWDHGGWGHARSLFDEVIRVPLLVHGKGAIAQRVPGLARLIDIAPTVLALADIPAAEGFAGTNLLPVVRGEADTTGVREAYAELWKTPSRAAEAIVTESGRKLIRARDGDDEEVLLFDLEADRSENEDLTAQRGRGAEVADLLGRLDRIGAEVRSGGVRSSADLDEATRERLRSLGYIE